MEGSRLGGLGEESNTSSNSLDDVPSFVPGRDTTMSPCSSSSESDSGLDYFTSDPLAASDT